MMKPLAVQHYRAPQSHAPLRLEQDCLVSTDGRRFSIENGVPNLLWPPELSDVEARTKNEYDRVAERIYDAALNWQFAALHEDEETVRELMVDMIDPKPGARILEVGCGTGRDSFRLARRLDASGELFLQDLSSGMVHTCVRRMSEYDREMRFRCGLHYSISNATYLPFPSDFFDAVFHFGGFNEFSDGKKTAEEFARVVKPGGTVLFGDESVGPWLRDVDFGRIVTTNNPLFAHKLPLERPPPLALDLAHQGWRGGTMRSRYYGVMEGVTPEAKELARQAAAMEGVSVHEWLDRLVRGQASRDIAAKSRDT
jgi:ubiquinone/menaquinone biosynthesis C-methylase UbiE